MNLIYFQWQGERGTNAFICLPTDEPINIRQKSAAGLPKLAAARQTNAHGRSQMCARHRERERVYFAYLYRLCVQCNGHFDKTFSAVSVTFTGACRSRLFIHALLKRNWNHHNMLSVRLLFISCCSRYKIHHSAVSHSEEKNEWTLSDCNTCGFAGCIRPYSAGIHTLKSFLFTQE